ncbi:MAG: radical SAM protein [Acidobacteriia bacterium]|nr:radical SAM protein [Terriglobia bacterium]
MKHTKIVPAWGMILRGHRPFLSIEITRECPLRCPGCYAYEPNHLQDNVPLRQLRDFQGEALIQGVLRVVRRYRPLHLSIVGGEPLVRYRELDVLLPQLDAMNVEVQLVTSAVRPIPRTWGTIPCLHLVVSIDGLQPEHDRRRAPATYERILKNIEGHQLTVHCTITRLMIGRAVYFEQFADFWSKRREARKIWFSLYTPQEDDSSADRLRPEERIQILSELREIRRNFPKVELPDRVLEGFYCPPDSPDQCIFAQTTTCLSADLSTRIGPCQFGGRLVCQECGCVASAAMASTGRYRIAGLLTVSSIFAGSKKLGERLGKIQGAAKATAPISAGDPHG